MLDSVVRFSVVPPDGQSTVVSLLDRLNAEFEILWGREPYLLRTSQRIRHQVYCAEHPFEEPPPAGEPEQDEFDSHALYSILVHRPTGVAVGTVRLILPREGQCLRSFPLQRLSGDAIFRGSHELPLQATAQVSGFAITRELRRCASVREEQAFGRDAPARLDRLGSNCAPLMRLGLLQALVVMSAHSGITHWCALMEPHLIRIFAAMGIHGEPMGDPVEYRGPRQACIFHVEQFLRRMRRERPAFWDVLTCGGVLHSADRASPWTKAVSNS